MNVRVSPATQGEGVRQVSSIVCEMRGSSMGV